MFWRELYTFDEWILALFYVLRIDNFMKTQVYGFYLYDEEALQRSSSGGAFTALSNAVFAQGGTVIACIYDYDREGMRFCVSDDPYTRDQMRGSKYIQANNNELYTHLASELNKEDCTPLLIVGTPCQIAGARAWIRCKHVGTSRKIIYCDLICHGVSSPQMWKAYLREKIDKYQEKISFVTFKNKSKGWLRPTTIAEFESGKRTEIEDYAMLYRSRDFMRPSCYHCKFASTRRDTDITIGDFWGIQEIDSAFANLHGTSLVLVHTTLGQSLFEKATVEGAVRPSKLEECLQPGMKESTKPSLRYKDVHKDYENHGLSYTIEKYIHYGPGTNFVRRCRRKWFRIKYRED